MKKIFFAILILLGFFQSFSQTIKPQNTVITLSVGRVSFGTGDFLGSSIGFGASKNVLKKSNWGLSKLLLGGEFIVENGVKNPVIRNPTFEEFLEKSFYHTSNILLWTKASYYPFKKIIKGFSIDIGPTFGYSYRSNERSAIAKIDGSGNSFRQSILSFDNGYTIGYRVSTSVEVNVSKRILVGFKLDFSNNNKAEINTLMGIKLGWTI